MARPSVTVEQFFKEHGAALQMRLVSDGGSLKRPIREPTVNRPGLALSGFTRYFAHKRIQAIGHAESYFLKSLPQFDRAKHLADLFAFKMPCVVFSRGLRPDKEFLQAAKTAGVPIFQTPLVTMKFINAATLALEMMFAPRGTEIGSMVDILGVGVLIRGESGIGKSEAVLALIERGYSLVSDDITRVTLVDGQPHGNPRHRHHQCRGHVRRQKHSQGKNPRPCHHPQAMGGSFKRGPAGHGTGICQSPGRGHSPYVDSRAAGARFGAVD
jgi:HPr kinase/phosphorylase